MKKFGLIALALVTVTGVYAQKGVEDGSRYGHGQDSINTLKNISIYSEFVKTKNSRCPEAFPAVPVEAEDSEAVS